MFLGGVVNFLVLQCFYNGVLAHSEKPFRQCEKVRNEDGELAYLFQPLRAESQNLQSRAASRRAVCLELREGRAAGKVEAELLRR